MKEFLKGLLILIGAIVITVIYLPIGIPYTYLHAIYWTIKGVEKRKKGTFLWLIWRQIDGTFAAIGYMAYHIGVGLDMIWNVNGEFIEDCTTTVEDTMFGLKNTTVSTATGKEELEGRQKPRGKWFNKALNVMFGQKRHAVDSYELHLKRKELDEIYFQ